MISLLLAVTFQHYDGSNLKRDHSYLWNFETTLFYFTASTACLLILRLPIFVVQSGNNGSFTQFLTMISTTSLSGHKHCPFLSLFPQFKLRR